ncbi:alpha/beta hydrolase [Streptomyces albidoflavus]|uniref:alpha/beta hydrolase n=1 Tax=Streptomyces TaxID=1883 RepID=UPI00101E36EE|nr:MULTISPECIES: alpha/beta hydrolase [Streptomyces]QHC14353.1 alpha/beta hydrolase [Streptomyces sp. GF20]RZD54719.1 alpha/beta hydrolase [Streptomyces albidoflavus]RZD54874.1 alpha/beta hydrolase [Streptomyces albidoflavus]
MSDDRVTRQPEEAGAPQGANDIEELKQFVGVHGRILGIPPARLREVLGRVRHDRDGEPGSWAREWTEAGRELERLGREVEAGRHFNIARFPFVDGPARADAQERTVASFDRWRLGDTSGIRRLDLGLSGGRVRCWAAGLAPRGGELPPLLLLSGGIVSVKEQFGPILTKAARFGLAVVATEMPGVGENEQRYTADSHRAVSELLDALADRADVTRTVAVMMSFSGHTALRAALDDRRIRGVVTAGAPVGDFFTDEAWRPRVPRVTVDTLAHLTGHGPESVLHRLADRALTPKELAALDVPVAYTVSARDEIVPPGDRLLLERHVSGLRLLVHDDVHGSPSHVAESRLWSLRSALDMLGGHGAQRAVLGAALSALRARERLSGAAGRRTGAGGGGA